MIQRANRVTALVFAVATCLVLTIQMLQACPPLESLRCAILSATFIGAFAWMATLVGSSVVSDALQREREEKNGSTSERKE